MLQVDGLSKKYCRDLRWASLYGLADIAREFLPMERETALRPKEFWALRDVSFELGRGEALAVLGANGAGKSTLMKVLHGLQKPDAGQVRLSGRVEALIELGAGFNPLMTGRENIDLSGALHGYGRAERRALELAVAEFSELGAFLDAPVQSYSSGMAARLAYALSVSLRPDVLLIDEVLAVGDRGFQRKCIESMQAFVSDGGSLLVVSHQVGHAQALCRRAIVLDQGRCVFEGDVLAGLAVEPQARARRLDAAVSDSPEPGVAVEEVCVTTLDGAHPRSGEAALLRARYRSDAPLEAIWGFSLWTADESVCISGDFDFTPRVLDGVGELQCVLPRLPLLRGGYMVKIALANVQTLTPLGGSHWHTGAPFTVSSQTDLAAVAQAAMNQLVKFDVEWR